MSTVLFPTVVLDNFLDEPFQFVDLANRLKYENSKDGLWPGTRTEDLVINYPEMTHRVVKKILSLYYNPQDEVSWSVSAFFQKVSSRYNQGWIHLDPQAQLTSIIYFCNSGFGTSIYTPKDISTFGGIVNADKKHESYSNFSEIDKYSSYREENNKQFVKTIGVDSNFNRMFCFEGGSFHGVDNFENKADTTERLTMVLFISNILSSSRFPIERSRFCI